MDTLFGTLKLKTGTLGAGGWLVVVSGAAVVFEIIKQN